MEEKSPQMSRENSKMFDEWMKKLVERKVFEDVDMDEMMVTNDNLEEILNVLEIDDEISLEEAHTLLDFYQDHEASFYQFHADLLKLLQNKGDINLENVVNAYQTPAERIVKSLLALQQLYLKDDPVLQREITFAINNINERKIFSTLQDHFAVNLALKRDTSQIVSWLNEYSEYNKESSSSMIVKSVKMYAQKRISDISIDKSKSGDLIGQKRKSFIRTLLEDYDRVEPYLVDTNKRTFDLFAFNLEAGREKTLPLLTMHLFMQHNLEQFINERKFAVFLNTIQNTYMQKVQYHNDLHGVDVAHMAHLFLTQGNLINLAELDHIDIMSFLTAGVCHDLGHDGFTNGYHCNALTDRAIRYNDVSVQENYHVAETFAILAQDEINFIEKLNKDEFKVLRKRIIGCILATDMAKHAADFSALKSLVETKQIKNGENSQLIINKENETTLFKSQQFILECCLHSCDISQQTRPFKVVKEWTYLLYEEFFNQGDTEKEKGLPISFLCNRNTTNIPKAQPGFINGITIPLWTVLAEIMPSMKEYVEAAKENVVCWENYEETEEDKKTY